MYYFTDFKHFVLILMKGIMTLRAKCYCEGHMRFSEHQITKGTMGVLLLDYRGHHVIPVTCVHVELTVGVYVNSGWLCSSIMSMLPKPPASATPLSDTEWLVTYVDWATSSLFTLAIVLVHFTNLAFNNGLMNLYLCFGVFDLYIINILHVATCFVSQGSSQT